MEKQTAPFSAKLLKYSIALILPVLLLLSACKDDEPDGGGAPNGKEFKMNCVMLTHDQVKTWVDSGWTKPGPGAINDILLQFYSANAAASNTNMQLIAYPGESITKVKLGGEQLLAIDTTCKAVPFSGKIVLANNEASIDKMDILNEDGSLKEFDYIRFTPKTFGMNKEYITFKMEVITKGEPRAVEGSGTRPCPPYCCPPWCD